MLVSLLISEFWISEFGILCCTLVFQFCLFDFGFSISDIGIEFLVLDMNSGGWNSIQVLCGIIAPGIHTLVLCR